MEKKENKIPQELKDSIKQRAGYLESDNKKDVLTGSGMAFRIAEDHYSKQIEHLTMQRDNYMKAYEETRDEIKTVAGIIRRYF